MNKLFTTLARMLGLAVLGLLLGCGKAVVLQSGLNDADANEIVALLRHQGIAADKQTVKGVVSLQVPEDALARATEAMRSAGLPRRGLSDLGQVFKKEGMISTPLEERVRYLHGLSEELAATLQQIDGVVTARVHVVLPERIAPGEPVQPSSAAVFIKMRAPFDEDATVPRIRRMVAGSIPGLAGDSGIDKVSVILAPAADAPPDVAWHTAYGVTVLAASRGRLDALVWGLGGLAVAALLALAGLALRRLLAQRRGAAA